MSTAHLVATNLTSPPVLAFGLGAATAVARGDVRLPEAVHHALAAYLLLAIGIKGGNELRSVPLGEAWPPLLAAVLLGVATPLLVLAVTRWTRFGAADRASLAAHYGSVSVVTFTAATAFLQAADVPVERVVSALVAVMEVPAILVALVFAARAGAVGGSSTREALREVLVGRSVVLLVGGIVLGFVATDAAFARVEPFFVGLFPGLLVLFLLDLGVTAAGRLGAVRAAGPALLTLALALPVVQGALGVLAGRAAGLSVGGTAVLGVLAASASYIAAPAAVRVALPQADLGVSLAAALGVTFPFNLAVGIPLYYWMATLVH